MACEKWPLVSVDARYRSAIGPAPGHPLIAVSVPRDASTAALAAQRLVVGARLGARDGLEDGAALGVLSKNNRLDRPHPIKLTAGSEHLGNPEWSCIAVIAAHGEQCGREKEAKGTHRNTKVLLDTHTGQSKLLHFGVARALAGAERIGETKAVLGAPQRDTTTSTA